MKNPSTKKCRVCKKYKKLNSFYAHKTHKYRVRSECKLCSKTPKHKVFCMDCRKLLGQQAYLLGTKRCKTCANSGKNNPMFGKKLSIITKRKMSQAQKGHKRSLKTGRTKTKQGYILIYCPEHPKAYRKNYVFEHRLMMERKLGRYLNSNEIIHHMNGIKDDNRIENLLLTTKKQHDTHTVAKLLQERIRQLEKELNICKS